MASFIRVTSRTYKNVVYWLNPLLIAKVWREDEGTRVDMFDGKTLFINEDANEIAGEINRRMDK